MLNNYKSHTNLRCFQVLWTVNCSIFSACCWTQTLIAKLNFLSLGEE